MQGYHAWTVEKCVVCLFVCLSVIILGFQRPTYGSSSGAPNLRIDTN